MSSQHFEFVVIGGGSAGFAAARTARETMDRVAIIDGAETLGGLCILRGCMPSKTLIYSAEVLHLAQIGHRFGLDIPTARADMAAVHARKRRTIDEFASYRQEQLTSDRFTLFRDRAAFVDEQTVQLQTTGDTITADRFLIATGSVVNRPKEVPGLADVPAWTSDEVLNLDFVPESVIVLGGGIVGSELAQFLLRVGSEVTKIQRSATILKETSPEAALTVTKAFRDEGMRVHTNTQITGIEKTAKGIAVNFLERGEKCRVEAAHLFNALGRIPATKGLGLEAAGVELGKGGQIEVNAFQQTSNPRIYAAGDVSGPFEIVHLAIMQAEVAAKHARGEAVDTVNYDTRTSVVFTDPQVASAGIPLNEAKERGIDLLIAEYPFDDHGKSILMEAPYGFVRVWADRKSGRVVGAECVGKDAGELIHAMAVGVSMGATVADLLKVHWYHPTLSEIWSYPLEDIAEELPEMRATD